MWPILLADVVSFAYPAKVEGSFCPAIEKLSLASSRTTPPADAPGAPRCPNTVDCFSYYVLY